MWPAWRSVTEQDHRRPIQLANGQQRPEIGVGGYQNTAIRSGRLKHNRIGRFVQSERAHVYGVVPCGVQQLGNSR